MPSLLLRQLLVGACCWVWHAELLLIAMRWCCELLWVTPSQVTQLRAGPHSIALAGSLRVSVVTEQIPTSCAPQTPWVARQRHPPPPAAAHSKPGLRGLHESAARTSFHRQVCPHKNLHIASKVLPRRLAPVYIILHPAAISQIIRAVSSPCSPCSSAITPSGPSSSISIDRQPRWPLQRVFLPPPLSPPLLWPSEHSQLGPSTQQPCSRPACRRATC